MNSNSEAFILRRQAFPGEGGRRSILQVGYSSEISRGAGRGSEAPGQSQGLWGQDLWAQRGDWSDSEISSSKPAKKLNHHETLLLVVLINQVQSRPTDQFLLLHRPWLCSPKLQLPPNKWPPPSHKGWWGWRALWTGQKEPQRRLTCPMVLVAPMAPLGGPRAEEGRWTQSWRQGWYTRMLPVATRRWFTLGAASSSKDPQSWMETACILLAQAPFAGVCALL